MTRHVEQFNLRRLEFFIAHYRIEVNMTTRPAAVISLRQTLREDLRVDYHLRKIEQSFSRRAQTQLKLMILKRADAALHALQVRPERSDSAQSRSPHRHVRAHESRTDVNVQFDRLVAEIHQGERRPVFARQPTRKLGANLW